MKFASYQRIRFALGCLAILVAVGALVWRLSKTSKDGRQEIQISLQSKPPANQATPSSLAQPQNNSNSTLLTPSPSAPGPTPPLSFPEAAPERLIIPVAGVRPEQLHDTFSESRSEGRVHDAIDIAAPLGTPVLASADGTIVKLFHSERGGTTIYQLSADNKFVYYYAHLDRYAEGLSEGYFAKQGEKIGYVGDTGNAGAGNYHLHFSIAVISNPKRYWEGVNINPYPLLKR
jgi:murein DD-endopeptidase MepM/ murein hydrolase activator NlpD